MISTEKRANAATKREKVTHVRFVQHRTTENFLNYKLILSIFLVSESTFLGLIVTEEACLILCVYLSINSRHLTALIGSEAGESRPGLGGRWPAADLWPMRAQYCDKTDQSGHG